MTQPPRSGAPAPVQGVTGGPGLNNGNASIDPGTGNIVFTPPGNAVEIKKAPSTLNVYEYFNSAADNVRIALETAVGGPEFIGVRTFPGSVIRNLTVGTNGVLNLTGSSLTFNGAALPTGTTVSRYLSQGTVSSPSTTSTTPVAIPDMTLNVTNTGTSDIAVWLVVPITSSAVVTSQIAMSLQLDSAGQVATMINQVQAAGPNNALVLTTFWLFRLVPAGAHTITGFWSTQSGTITAAGALRYILGLQFNP